MAQLQKFRSIAQNFVSSTKLEDPYQIFLLGTIAGYYMQYKQEDLVQTLQNHIQNITQIVGNGLSKKRLFEDTILNLVNNLESPKLFDFQGTPNLSEAEEQPQKIYHKSTDEDATLALIKQLQAEDEQTQMKMKKKIEDEQVDCPICYTSLMDDQVYPLEHCVHIFHVDCLKEYIMQAISEKRSCLLCPDSECKTELAIKDIGSVAGLDKQQEFESYTLNQFVDNHADQMSWCPTPDCKFAFMFADDENDRELKCPLCKRHYCLNCRVIFHKGQSCKEYQITNTRDKNDEKFEKFVTGHKFKMCSKCKFWVEKNQGCNHMTCRCGYQFCYACGGKYMECECVRKQREQFERQRELIAQRQQQRQQNKSKRGKRR